MVSGRSRHHRVPALRPPALQEFGIERFTKKNIDKWAAVPPRPDSDAAYAGRITLDLGEVTPHVSGPDTVQVMQSLAAWRKRG